MPAKNDLNPDKLRATLLALRAAMSRSQDSLRRDILGDSGRAENAKAPIHLAEQASDEQELDLMVERLTSSSETLADIDEALDRLETGNFNVCAECGGEIGLRRLIAKPWATVCVSCKRKAEEES